MLGWVRKLLAGNADTESEDPTQPQQIFRPEVTSPPDYVPPQDGHRFLALDVETANGDPASICQIGIAACSPDGTITTFGTLINPRTTFSGANINIHGIRPEHVIGKPSFDVVIKALLPVLTQSTVFQHSSFDRTAINAACESYRIPILQIRWQDSVKIAQRAWPEFKGNGGHGLAHLKKALDLKFNHHNALEDARAAAQVVLLAERHTKMNFEEILAPRRKVYAPPVKAEGDEKGALFGQIACFTGALSISRENAAEHAARAGITVKANVTSKTTLLIVGDQDLSVLAGHSKSTKHRKAEQMAAEGHCIRIIGESEFLALVARE